MIAWKTIMMVPVLIAVSVLIAPLIALAAICWSLISVLILIGTWLCWRSRGKVFLIVYSDSDLWRGYFESEVLPYFKARAVVLNLSRDGGQKRWWKLEWMVYQHCASFRNRFPIVISFRQFYMWKTIRFYESYMKSKKGNTFDLEQAKLTLSNWRTGVG